jgi:hypothetical protein
VHRGAAEVLERPGGGSTFVLSLPVGGPLGDPPPDLSEGTPGGAP